MGSGRESLLLSDFIAGAGLEVADLESTRNFYSRLFEGRAGSWTNSASVLRFECGRQHLEFVRGDGRKLPPEAGRHHAYCVKRERLPGLVKELAGSGVEVHRWREDDPHEREVSVYLEDPSGNLVQLLPSDDDGVLLDHVAVAVHDLEPAEVFYAKVIGGRVGYYHGRKMDDFVEAEAWGEGRDPCAPWTRLAVEKRIPDERERRKIPRPNQQVFVRYGEASLGIILTREHYQEPPEEMRRGTPCVIFRTSASLREATARLAHPDVCLDPEGRINLTFETKGNRLFLRDPAGNFAQVICAG